MSLFITCLIKKKDTSNLMKRKNIVTKKIDNLMKKENK